jgi:hypothetical protein
LSDLASIALLVSVGHFLWCLFFNKLRFFTHTCLKPGYNLYLHYYALSYCYLTVISIFGQALITMIEETASMRHQLGDSGKLLFRVLEVSPTPFPSSLNLPRHIDVW